MRKIYLLFFVSLVFILSVSAQTEQYAASVIGFSTEYGTTNEACDAGWAACKLLGAYDVYPSDGDLENAWASTGPDDQREFLELGFATPQEVDSIFVYETYNPGAIDTVYLRNASTSEWVKVWEGTAAAGINPATIFKIEIAQTTYTVDAIRLAINSPEVSGWNEIDAVSIYKKELVTSIEEELSETIQLLPNPCQGTVTIDFGNLATAKSITLYNTVGQKVMELRDIEEKKVTLNTGLKEGLYSLEITSGSQRSIKKLIIQ